MPELYTRVILLRDLPAEQLRRGDLAWLIDHVDHPSRGERGAILEIFNVLGESMRVVTVPVSAIGPALPSQVPSVREAVMPA